MNKQVEEMIKEREKHWKANWNLRAKIEDKKKDLKILKEEKEEIISNLVQDCLEKGNKKDDQYLEEQEVIHSENDEEES